MADSTFNEQTVCYEDFEHILTTKELQCLCLKCEGKSHKEIAVIMNVSQLVVRNRMTKIYDKTLIRIPLSLCRILEISKRRTNWDARERIKGPRPRPIPFNPESIDENQYYTSVVARNE